MHIKIQASAKANGNKGSCNSLVNYLMKENLEGKTEELFFNVSEYGIEPEKVIEAIDTNKKKLGKADAKFYSIILSPSEKELEIMSNHESLSKTEALQHYTNVFMDEYALNFNRKGLNSADDLVYFAKIESERKFKGTDKDVKWGDRKSGEIKEGRQDHIHIVVSRKDVTQKLKLSPLTNWRKTPEKNNSGSPTPKGFDRVNLFNAAEREFDLFFECAHLRKEEETFNYRNKEKKNKKLKKEQEVERGLEPLKEREFNEKREKIADAFDDYETEVAMKVFKERNEKSFKEGQAKAREKQLQMEFEPTPERTEPKRISLEEILKREITNHEKFELLRNLRRSMINESRKDEEKAISSAILEFRQKYNNKHMDFKPQINKDKGFQR